MSKVRWGLLSTANINRRVIPAIRASARGELRAVASRSAEAAEAYARQWDIPQAFGSYEAMLESEAIDAVYIGLPNYLHAAWSIRALECGKHVLCEKPFAVSLAEVDAMIAAAERTGKVLAEAFMYRHHPQTKLVGEWVHGGRLGEIVSMRGHFSFKLTNRGNVRLVPEWGGGALWDVGVYPISLAQFLAGGPPDWVFGTQQLGESGVDEAFSGVLHYPDGQTAEIGCSFHMPFHTHFEALGTEGRLSMNRPFTGQDEPIAVLTYGDDDGRTEIVEFPHTSLYLGEVEDMHAAILDGTQPYVGLAETRNHVRTALALYESARRHEPVALDQL